jgi:hypothetical protein
MLQHRRGGLSAKFKCSLGNKGRSGFFHETFNFSILMALVSIQTGTLSLHIPTGNQTP